MIPYGTLHHLYIHARWTWPTFARAKAPAARRLVRRTPTLRRVML